MSADWPRGGYPAGDTPASELKPPPANMVNDNPKDHNYLSTACLHGHHDHCRAKVNLEGLPKEPASCKWCGSACQCGCHRT